MRNAGLFALCLMTTWGCATGRPSSGSCRSDAECDDMIVCTVDSCGVGGACRHAPQDGLCTAPETCSESRGCTDTSDCTMDSDCDDGVACTVDGCGFGGVCSNSPQDGLCGVGETCDAMAGCMAGTGCMSDAECDDMIACTVDTCGVGATCQHMAVDGLCSMGETCNASIGCQRPCATDAECQDGDFCNGAETCMMEFGCMPAAAPRTCNDSDPCTIDACDNMAGLCTFTCDPSMPACGCAPTADCSGTFALSPPESYMCAFSMVNYNLSTVTFTNMSGIVTIRPASASFPPLTDVTPPVCPDFDAFVEIAGGCIENYRLSGSFTDTDNFTATFVRTYTDMDGFSCAISSCGNLSTMVTGTRIP